MIPWYKHSFGPEYLRLYAHRDMDEAHRDVAAIMRLLALPQAAPLLDLCCGAGRHLVALQELGFTALTGLDLSMALLAAARQSFAEPTRAAYGSVPLLCADMRAIPFQNAFAAVLSLFTSFGYFEADDQNAAVFSTVYRALRNNGRFLLDYVNRDYLIAHLVAEDERTLPGRHLRNVRALTAGGRRVEKTTWVTTTDGSVQEFHESVRLYTPDEVTSMLCHAGFGRLRQYGALDGSPLSFKSSRLIVIAIKEPS